MMSVMSVHDAEGVHSSCRRVRRVPGEGPGGRLLRRKHLLADRKGGAGRGLFLSTALSRNRPPPPADRQLDASGCPAGDQERYLRGVLSCGNIFSTAHVLKTAPVAAHQFSGDPFAVTGPIFAIADVHHIPETVVSTIVSTGSASRSRSYFGSTPKPRRRSSRS